MSTTQIRGGAAGNRQPSRVKQPRKNFPPVGGALEQTVAELVHRHGLAPIELRWLRRKRGATSSSVYRRIDVGPDVADRPDSWQRWTAAHEVAHIVLDIRLRLPVAGLVAVMVLCSVGAFAIMGRGHALKAQLGVLLPLCLFLVCLIGVAAGYLASRWKYGRISRSREVVVDQLAKDWGYPLTPDIAAGLAPKEPALMRLRCLRGFRTHPYPHDRINSRTIGGLH